MTENKRFSVGLRKNTTQYELIDNWKTGEYPFIEPFYYEKTAKDLAKFLNALNDENEQFHNIARDYNIHFNKLCSTFEEVLEENEQLKKVIDEADDLIKSHLTNHYKTRWKHICEYYGVEIE